MKFSGMIEDGTNNEPLNFGSKLLPVRGLRSLSAHFEQRFALSECF